MLYEDTEYNNFNLGNDNNDAGFDAMRDISMWPEYCNPSYEMPNEIEIRIQSPTGEYYFPVTVQKFTSKKVYLGGYRSKLSGKVFHHANTQTPTESKSHLRDMSNLRTRETQTFEQRTLSVQPYRECGTQMQRIDLYLDDHKDVIKFAKPYFTSQKLLALKRVKTIEIQRCWRGYVARCRASRLRIKIKGYEQKTNVENDLIAQALREERQLEMQRRIHPKSKEDFAILFNELDAWRRGEIAKIKATTAPGPERKAAMSELLQIETKGLQNIEKLKAIASKETQLERTKMILELMAKPQQWQLSTGQVALVQTTSTARAKELFQLYQGLVSPLVSVDERLDTLLQVKWTVKEYEGSASLIRDITELVDREADLLNRGRPPKSMEALRTRLANLFLQFTEDPKYNPRASEYLGLPPAPHMSTTPKP